MAHRASKALNTFSAGDAATLLRARERDQRHAQPESSAFEGADLSAPAAGARVEHSAAIEPASLGRRAKETARERDRYSARTPLERYPARPSQRHLASTRRASARQPRSHMAPPERHSAAERRAFATARTTAANAFMQDGPRSTVFMPSHAATERTRASASAPRKTRSRTGSRGSSARGAHAAPSAASSALHSAFLRLGAIATGALQWFFDLKPRVRHALVGVGAILLVVGFFYDPAADLYAALRDHQQLERQSAQAQAQLQDLEERVATLQSEEGIIDEARIRGYVLPGEHAADATELLGEDDGAKPPPYSLEQETPDDPFYIQLLDKLLGYQGPRS